MISRRATGNVPKARNFDVSPLNHASKKKPAPGERAESMFGDMEETDVTLRENPRDGKP
jgi:hypothetical protein